MLVEEVVVGVGYLLLEEYCWAGASASVEVESEALAVLEAVVWQPERHFASG